MAADRKIFLVVDDEPLVLMGSAAMLESLGFEAIMATTGLEALAALESRPEIGGLITDQSMPDMDGSALVRAVFDRRSDIAIVIATGNSASAHPELPGCVMLYKPFNLAELEAAITAALASC
jgi:CheY-like chemotaxis protein